MVILLKYQFFSHVLDSKKLQNTEKEEKEEEDNFPCV